ncbi:hypothetical protein IFM89_009557 [Coptis chinensis]|uniref:Uncharacterized protein n=1 Tax=Coptis chinensis TaxID=261450 RepID=A0A835IL82_9MAGN|nr:hypothetical protein IFM89_009557 [Coptis chinensis]
MMLAQSTIGSVATAAEQAFVPYAERVLELMKIFMVLTNDEDLCSQARATDIGSTLAAFEIEAIRTWWHVREGEGMYEDEFAKANKVVGMGVPVTVISLNERGLGGAF